MISRLLETFLILELLKIEKSLNDISLMFRLLIIFFSFLLFLSLELSIILSFLYLFKF